MTGRRRLAGSPPFDRRATWRSWRSGTRRAGEGTNLPKQLRRDLCHESTGLAVTRRWEKNAAGRRFSPIPEQPARTQPKFDKVCDSAWRLQNRIMANQATRKLDAFPLLFSACAVVACRLAPSVPAPPISTSLFVDMLFILAPAAMTMALHHGSDARSSTQKSCIEALLRGESHTYLQSFYGLNDRAMVALLARAQSDDPTRPANCMPFRWWRHR